MVKFLNIKMNAQEINKIMLNKNNCFIFIMVSFLLPYCRMIFMEVCGLT